jgi:hypothetical protein
VARERDRIRNGVWDREIEGEREQETAWERE